MAWNGAPDDYGAPDDWAPTTLVHYSYVWRWKRRFYWALAAALVLLVLVWFLLSKGGN